MLLTTGTRAPTVLLPPGFVDLAPLVHDDDPAWMPEDGDTVARAFSPANPWFDRGEAAAWCLPGRARLAVFVEPAALIDGVPVAFFGYWETTGDDDADDALVERAATWARSRGARRLVGPIDFTTFGQYRLLTGGDAAMRPFPGEPYNPPTYPRRLERRGFTPVQRYASVVLDRGTVQKLADEYAPLYEQMIAWGYRVEPLVPERWTANLPELHRACDEIFGAQYAYTPVSYREFATTFDEGYARRLAPDLSALVWAPDGSLAGFEVAGPDWSPLLARDAGPHRVDQPDHGRDRGRLTALGPERILVRTGGARPAHRGRGLSYSMMAWLFGRMTERSGWDRCLVGIVREGNAVDHVLRPHAVGVRTYALYGKDL